MTLTWTDSLSLSYAERPRGRPRRDLEPVGIRPVFDRGPRLAPGATSRATTEDRAEHCARSLLVLVSCSIVQFDPSGRGPRGPKACGHGRSGCPVGAAAP